MSAECLASIHLCRVRVTRLDALGNPTAGPNNVYVSNTPLMLAVTPQIEAGQDKPLVSGCDCLAAEYRGYDKLKYFTLELDLALVEPALLEMLIGADAIVDTGDVTGIWWPSQVSCSDTVQPNVCFEGWQDAWEDDHQNTVLPYIHWIWPSSYWQIAAHTLQNDFLSPKVTAFTRSNTNWGEGIFGDLPEASGPLGGFFFTDVVPPTAECDYQTQAIT